MEIETSSNTEAMAVARVIIAEDDDMMLHLNDAVQSLPSQVTNELLSVKVCARCILRLFSIRDRSYYCPLPSTLRSVLREYTSQSIAVCARCILRLFGIRDRIYYCLSPSTLRSVIGEYSLQAIATENKDSCAVVLEKVEALCTVCLGVLQFAYRDDSGTLVKKKTIDDLALSIASLVKQEGHSVDHFSLEVSMPPIILENEHAVCSSMKKKYESELWFQEKPLSGSFSVKDALKYAITGSLEKVLDAKFDINSFRIRLTYSATKASNRGPISEEKNQDCKRRKTGNSGSVDNVNNELMTAVISDNSTSDTITGKSSNGLKCHKSSEVGEPLHLAVSCNRTPIFLAGRYLKYSRHVSQTRWIIDEERMGKASVEEIIGDSILPICRGDSYKFHAAGREDIDVRMLGSGRPFLIEIQNARQVPSEVLVKEMENKINNLEKKLIRIKNLKNVGSEGWALMREGEAEKQKQYAALVWVSRPLEDNDLQSICSFKDMQITQRTPVRVLHRRSPLDRERIIHWMKVERIADSSQYFLLHLCTQAGTYIKEFVHGDFGRTTPSIGSILGCRAEILQLDVTDVKMDAFVT